jgi:uncharacterized membrane protein YebE (DUF533 family)
MEQATMGLLDKIFFGGIKNKAAEELSSAEAFAAIALAAAACDGYLSDDEARGISLALSKMKLFRSLPNEVVYKMFDKLLGILRHEGVTALVRAAKDSLPYELQETAFAIAADLILSDGYITEVEESFLEDLHQNLNIPDGTATQIIKVMKIKNRGSVNFPILN